EEEEESLEGIDEDLLAGLGEVEAPAEEAVKEEEEESLEGIDEDLLAGLGEVEAPAEEAVKEEEEESLEGIDEGLLAGLGEVEALEEEIQEDFDGDALLGIEEDDLDVLSSMDLPEEDDVDALTEGIDEESLAALSSGMEEEDFIEGIDGDALLGIDDEERETGFDIDATLDELFAPVGEEDVEFDIDSILSESQEIEEEEKKKDYELSDFQVLFDEDERDLEFIRKEAEEQALEELGIRGDDEEEAPSDSSQEDAFEKPAEEGDGASEPFAGEDIENEDEFAFVYDEEEEGEQEVDIMEALLGVKNAREILKRVASICIGLFLCMGVITAGTYMVVEGQNQEKETFASQGLTDLSMAMLYKQLYDPQGPTDINSPNFSENYVRPILEDKVFETSPFETTNFLNDVSYEIAVYLNPERNRFLLLARPIQDMVQDFLPKGILIIDSNDMVVRRSLDAEPLDKLLEGKDSLEGVSDFDLSTMVFETEPLLLPYLDAGDPANGFSPPRKLEEMRPGSGNRIYNAPRYRLLTKALMDKGQVLFTGEANQDDIHTFRRMAKNLSDLDELIYYSNEGIEGAQEGYRALRTYVAGSVPILGYLTYDPETGSLASSHLLQEKDYPEVLEVAKFDPSVVSDQGASVANREVLLVEGDAVSGAILEDTQAMEDLPGVEALDEALLQIVAAKKQDLEEISIQMSELVDRHNREMVENFGDKYLALFDKYQKINADFEKNIHTDLETLYHQYTSDDPQKYSSGFYKAVEGAQLSSYVSNKLKSDIYKYRGKPLEKKDMEALMRRVVDSGTLSELSLRVEQLSSLLSSNLLSDASERVLYENMLRAKVLRKLSDLILSPEAKKTKDMFQKANRQYLDLILRNSNVSEEDERRFYLAEFDSLMREYRYLPDSSELSQLSGINQKLADLSAYDTLLSEDDRKEIRNKHLEAIEEVEEEEDSLGELQEQIATLPVSGLHVMSSKDVQDRLGRMGQQQLVKAGLESEGEARNASLENAIVLLKENLEENRGLWGDVLEARRMMTQSSENRLLGALESGVGFSQNDRPLPIVIKTALTKYFDEKKKLTTIRDEQQYIAQYEVFKIKEQKHLENILNDVKKVQDAAAKLRSESEEYTRKLQDFANDYETAKLQGFFVTDLQIQSLMAARLGRKIYHAERLSQRVKKLTGQLVEASKKHGEIAQLELDSLEGFTPVTIDELESISQEAHEVIYPNLFGENLKGRFDKIRNISITPLQ
ncbi:MAG: hypothetical protein ACI9S8_002258, partial [Chlamydiales bacterium]